MISIAFRPVVNDMYITVYHCTKLGNANSSFNTFFFKDIFYNRIRYSLAEAAILNFDIKEQYNVLNLTKRLLNILKSHQVVFKYYNNIYRDINLVSM